MRGNANTIERNEATIIIARVAHNGVVWSAEPGQPEVGSLKNYILKCITHAGR